MKKTNLLLILLITSIAFTSAQVPAWQWAHAPAGGNKSDYTEAIAADASGNLYMTGHFTSYKIIFGTDTLNNNTTTEMAFLVKYDNGGNMLWSRGAGLYQQPCISSALTVDADGNVYIAGHLNYSVAFGTDTIKAGWYDAFIIKYDSDGHVLWTKSWGGANNEEVFSLATDATGNLWVTGRFGSTYIVMGSDTLRNSSYTGNYNMFLAKIEPDGQVLWAKCTGGGSTGSYVVVDTANGGAVVSGSFYGAQMIVGTDTLTNGNPSFRNIFIAKYTEDGNALWAESTGQSDHDEEVGGLAVDVEGNLFMAGYYKSGTITFGSISLHNVDSTNTNSEIFLFKFDKDGTALWAKTPHGSSFDDAQALCSDAGGNVYVGCATASTTITFDNYIFHSAGSYDMVVAKYDGNGNVLWAIQAGGAGSETANSLALDPSGNLFVGGNFTTNPLMLGSVALNSNGNNVTVFLAKLGNSTVNVSEHIKKAIADVYPNPTNGILTIRTNENISSIEVFNNFGKNIYAFEDSKQMVKQIDLSYIPAGVYVLQLKSDRVIAVKKFIKE